MAIPFLNSRTQWLDADGNPISYGRVSFYEAGTSTPKSVYTSKTEAVEADNPMPLDSGGYHQEDIWLGSGEYKYELQKIIGYDSVGNPLYTTVYTKDNIPGAPISPDGIVDTAVVAFVDDLRDITGGDYDAVYVLNYSSINDNGGGWFIWSPTETSTDDGGMIISSLGDPAVGRFVRQVEGNVIYNTYYGIKRNDNTANYAGQINNMSNFCSASSDRYTMWFIPGTYNISAHITFNDDVNLVLEENVQFVNNLNSGNALNVVINSRNVKIDQNINICNMPFTNLFYNPVNGPIAKSSWYDNVFGVITDAGFLFEHIGLNESYSNLIVNKVYRIGTEAAPNLSLFNVAFEDDGRILLDGQDLAVKSYENRHGGQIWDGDVDRLSVTDHHRIRVSDFVGSNAITSTEMLDLTSYATSSSTSENYIYFDNGDYTYDSAGAPTGDIKLTYVFENNSKLDVTGALYLYTAIGVGCFSGSGTIRSALPVELEWFPRSSAGLAQALASTSATSSSNVLHCNDIEIDMDGDITLTLLQDLVIKDINLFNDTVDGPTSDKLLTFTGDHTVEFIGGKIISTTNNLGAIRCTQSSLVMDGVYVRANDNTASEYIIYCYRALADGNGICKITDCDIGVQNDANNTELIYAFNVEDVIIDANRLIGRTTSGTTVSDAYGKVVVVPGGIYSSVSDNVCKGYVSISALGAGSTSIDNNTHPVLITVTSNQYINVNNNDAEIVSIDTKAAVQAFGSIVGNSGNACSIGTNIKSVSNHKLVFKANAFVTGDTTNYVGLKTDTDTTTGGAGGTVVTLTADFSDIPVKTGEIEVTYHLDYDTVSGVTPDYFRSGVVTTSAMVASISYTVPSSEEVTGDVQFIQVNEGDF